MEDPAPRGLHPIPVKKKKKPWLPWPQLSYRLSAQPLIPPRGTRRIKKLFRRSLPSSARWPALLLGVADYRLRSSLVFSASFPIVSSCVALHLSFVFLIASFLSSSLCLGASHSCLLDSVATSLCRSLSSSPCFSPCPPPSLPALSLSVPRCFPISLPYFSARCANPLLSTSSNNPPHPALLFCHYGYLY